MATFVVADGAVTSWAETSNIAILAGASATSFRLTVDAPENDQTKLGTGVVFREFLRGIRSWNVEMNARLAIPKMGNTGLVTAEGTDIVDSSTRVLTGAYGWTMDIAGDDRLSTVFNASGVHYESYLPGILNWGGTIETRGDTEVAPLMPVSVAAALFKLLENGASDHTLGGAIELLSVSPSAQVGEVYEASYRYRGTGALTAAGTSGSGIPAPIFAAGALTRFTVGSAVLTATTGRTFTGNMFATSVSISCMVNEPISVTISARGTGALAVA